MSLLNFLNPNPKVVIFDSVYDFLFLPGCIFVISSLIIIALSGIYVTFSPSLKARAHRKIFLHISYITSFSYGIILNFSVINGRYLFLNNVLLFGALIIFILSFKYPLFRRKSLIVPSIWSLVCILISIIMPF